MDRLRGLPNVVCLLGRGLCHGSRLLITPFKTNAERRHYIPKQRHRVTNWSAYDAALRGRGSLTVWFAEEAVAAWQALPRITRGEQPCYSVLAITTALTLGQCFAWRCARPKG